MADPDPDPHTKSPKPKSVKPAGVAGECVCEHCDFIRRVLIPEMVHDRYFCEPGSREFVEFDSVDVEHFDRKSNRKNMLHRVTARVKFSGVTHSFPLIIKLPEPHVNLLSSSPFLNEEMFYSKMTLNYGTDGIPKCYLSDLGRYDRPVIVLEDLAARGYTQVDDKLDEDHLKLCMKALATIHGKGLKLRACRFPVFREFYAKLSVPADWLHFHTSTQTGNVRSLEAQDNPESLDTSLYSALPVDGDLSEKIRKKRDVTTKLELNDFWTICHGNFTRNNLLFRYENGKPSDVKVIDWSTMRYCSPSIDFGHILLQNLPDDRDDNLSTIEAFCRNILRIYLDAVKDEYPEVDRELLEREIIANVPFAYGIIENRVLREAGMMLHTLDLLGSFD
ncbi:uncharacterized protein LOC112453819 [Temnothorax curvispinosus]|uniref:Uncharacterized protein LOC112453819 n=1 Tax=Temnothorax curvispinosus TaxID=300111 RepID=A0A6J1PLL3_9HYME|nr:uncharacterized protein LOC112453819 [Temnothorax curvispinosus]